jgi:hypothetical protein
MLCTKSTYILWHIDPLLGNDHEIKDGENKYMNIENVMQRDAEI